MKMVKYFDNFLRFFQKLIFKSETVLFGTLYLIVSDKSTHVISLNAYTYRQHMSANHSKEIIFISKKLETLVNIIIVCVHK